MNHILVLKPNGETWIEHPVTCRVKDDECPIYRAAKNITPDVKDTPSGRYPVTLKDLGYLEFNTQVSA